MPNGIDALSLLFNNYKTKENRTEKKEQFIKKLDNIINLINNRKYIIDLDEIEDIVRRYETTETDSTLLDTMLNINRYNVYLMNKKIKYVEPNLDKNIEFVSANIDLKDILNYLEVDIKDLDESLSKDLNKYVNKDEFINFATYIKGSNGIEHILYEKIQDKNVLIAILLHSNIDTVKNILNIIDNETCLLNKLVPNMPFIFIKEKINNKCLYDVPTYYNNFKENIDLLNNKNIPIKVMLNYPIFFINNVEKNKEIIKKLEDLNVNVLNVLTHIGNIIVGNIDKVIKNIKLLEYHNIELTDDDNNNGYTILGMNNLDMKIDYLIETNKWKKSLGKKHDNIDLIRALFIKDNYVKWKNNFINNIEKNELFDNKTINTDIIDELYKKYPILNLLDNKYLYEDNYKINDCIISRHRLLSNLFNYKGQDNIFINSLKYNTFISEENMNKIINIINEMS